MKIQIDTIVPDYYGGTFTIETPEEVRETWKLPQYQRNNDLYDLVPYSWGTHIKPKVTQP